MAFLNEPSMHNLFDSLDLSGIPRYPNQFHGYDPNNGDWKNKIPNFNQDKDLASWNAIWSMKAILDLKVVHEDIKMKIFMLSFDLTNDDVYEWYEGLPKKGVHSIEEFIKVFCERWDPYFKGDIGYLMDDDTFSSLNEDSDKDQPLESSHVEAIIEGKGHPLKILLRKVKTTTSLAL